MASTASNHFHALTGKRDMMLLSKYIHSLIDTDKGPWSLVGVLLNQRKTDERHLFSYGSC